MDWVIQELDHRAADCKPSSTFSAPTRSVDIAPVSVSGQCVGVINGSQNAHLSGRPFTFFAKQSYESDIDASGSVDPRNETLGNEPMINGSDGDATTVHKSGCLQTNVER